MASRRVGSLERDLSRYTHKERSLYLFRRLPPDVNPVGQGLLKYEDSNSLFLNVIYSHPSL